MPGFVPAPGITAVTLDWIIDGQPAVTTFHYDTGHLTSPDIVGFCEEVENYIAAHWLVQLCDETQLIKVRGRSLDSQFDNEGQWVPATELNGTDASGLKPNNVSFAVKRYTGTAGRQNRGRVYWPGITNAMVDSPNTLKAVQAAAFVTVLTGLLTSLAGAPIPGAEVLLHRSTGTHIPVAGYTVTDLNLDSQRRRLPGHNIHR